jgi:hypothetical protein
MNEDELKQIPSLRPAGTDQEMFHSLLKKRLLIIF